MYRFLLGVIVNKFSLYDDFSNIPIGTRKRLLEFYSAADYSKKVTNQIVLSLPVFAVSEFIVFSIFIGVAAGKRYTLWLV